MRVALWLLILGAALAPPAMAHGGGLNGCGFHLGRSRTPARCCVKRARRGGAPRMKRAPPALVPEVRRKALNLTPTELPRFDDSREDGHRTNASLPRCDRRHPPVCYTGKPSRTHDSTH